MIEPELVAFEDPGQGFRGAQLRGRADRFVRVLGAFLDLILAAAAVERLTEPADDVRARRLTRRIGDARRVGAHVGDEALRPVAAAEVDALVERLGDLHRLADAEPQLARGFLLERRGRERCRRVASRLAGLDRCHPEGRVAQRRHDRLGLLAVGDLGLLAVDLVELRREDDLRSELRQLGRDRPILPRNEGADLALAVDDQPHGNRLHAAGREAAADLRPQQRRDLIADQPVENPAGLLGVHHRHIDRMRVLERLEDGVFGDLVQLDPLRVLELQELGQMPCDRFAFAIRVGRQVDFRGDLRGRLEVLDDVALPLNGEVARHESVQDVDAQRRLREVADVAHRCLHDVPRRQEFLDGFGFRR